VLKRKKDKFQANSEREREDDQRGDSIEKLKINGRREKRVRGEMRLTETKSSYYKHINVKT